MMDYASLETGSEPVLTIGHSTRSFEQLTGLLETNGVGYLIDVRSFSRSRRHPWFNEDVLPQSLYECCGTEYSHLRRLGGRRAPQPGSPNHGWRNPSFQGYADHMRTQGFRRDFERLLEFWEPGRRVCLMCSEAVPWRCHRRIIADALLVRGFAVEHVLDERQRKTHTLTPWAEVEEEGRLTYPTDRVDQDGG